MITALLLIIKENYFLGEIITMENWVLETLKYNLFIIRKKLISKMFKKPFVDQIIPWQLMIITICGFGGAINRENWV